MAEKSGTNLDFSALERLRAEVQDLQKIIQMVGKGRISLAANADYINKKTHQDITSIVADLKPEGVYADNITNIRNGCEEIQLNPLLRHPHVTYEALELTQHVSLLDSQLRDIVFQIGYLTIPNRLNQWLADQHPGYYIPFHEVFKDEMPNYEDRVKMLKYLSLAPTQVDGLIDTDTGLIYYYSTSMKSQIFSIVILAFAVVLAIGIVIGAAYLPVAEWQLQPKNPVTLLIGWLAVVIGIIVHLGVTTAKLLQTQKSRPPVIAICDFPKLINAKLGQALLKVLLTLVGFFGLVIAVGIENAKPFNAFLVGYSLDSVVDLFGGSIEKSAAAQVSGLKMKLGG